MWDLRLLAQRIGLEKRDMEALEMACLFHNVGKIKTRDAIPLKRGHLTPEEYGEMTRHAEYGAAILGAAPSLRLYIPAVRHHHEWFDGTGYPDGLGGSRIPLHASIIAIADAFDAMTSDRPYRDALPAPRGAPFVDVEAAETRLANCSDSLTKKGLEQYRKGELKKAVGT
jgi:HD-GYP domain-containing protein (c-di-GMP phosphodiesterase class II)